jgi:hypothetical protein
MKNLINLLMVILFTTQILGQQKDLSGIWSGKLQLPNTLKLTVVFHIQKDSLGQYNSNSNDNRILYRKD